MIITSHGFPAVNILHSINNSYKCTDRVYLFSQAEGDCNLYLQKLYWERDLNGQCDPPMFTLPRRNIMLLRQDLADVDRVNPITSVHSTRSLVYNHDGYIIGEHLFNGFHLELYSGSTYDGGDSRVSLPRVPRDFDNLAFYKFLLLQPYFAPHSIRIRIGNRNLISTDLENFDVKTAPALRLRFGEPRQVHAVLFYRTYWGRRIEEVWQWNSRTCGEVNSDKHSLQLLHLPEYSDTYEKIFDLADVQNYTEPGENVPSQDDPTVRPFEHDCEYRGGVPCVVNLDSSVSTKELFFRWTGYLTHFQLLDSPIIQPQYWTLADNEPMEFNWQHLAEKILLASPAMANSIVDFSRVKIESLGDISTGIRFRHPVKAGRENSYGSTDNPYGGIDYYTAEPIGFAMEGYLGDIWRLRGVRANSDAYSSDYEGDHWLYGKNIYEHRNPNGTLAWAERDAGDNLGYVVNKLLLRWYYIPETNMWRSNHTRLSTPDQLRLLVVLPRAELVRGCINPMSNPATFNKPMFTEDGANWGQYVFHPGLYQHYNVPWRVLIEGRADNRSQTPWELMDEFTLEHFSARSHTYFSYPKRVQYIRITVQDWYGSSLMEDMKKDYVYPYAGTDSYRSLSGHYGKYSAVVPSASDLAIYHSQDNLGTLMLSSGYAALRREWERWKADPLRDGQSRTFQSFWKGIYIPPFLFFGDNGEGVQ